MGNFSLPADMTAFAAYLKSAEMFIKSPSIQDVRDGTRALRAATERKVPAVGDIATLSFEGCDYRIYRPLRPSAGRAGVFFHGGGWTHLDLDVYDPICRRLCVEGPMTVIAPEYPLAPETPFPDNILWCERFVRHVQQSAASLGIPERFALSGDSAGANIAVAVAMLMRDKGERFVDALSLAYGAFDLANPRPSYIAYGQGDLPLTMDGARRTRELYIPNPDERRNPLASPLAGQLGGLPPTFLCIATHDILYDENIDMASRLGYAGVDVSLRIYPNTIHGFLEAESVVGSSIATDALRDLARFAAARGPFQTDVSHR